MKQFWLRLSSWWFATMVPVSGPLSTIDARETLRKRRLLSSILLVASLAGLLFAIEDLFFGTNFTHFTNVISLCIPLCALWVNQRGYLKWASFSYLLPLLLSFFLIITFSALSIPVSVLYVWPILLLLPVIGGLVLPAWGPLLFCMLEIAFMCWFARDGDQSQIALYIRDPLAQIQFLCISGVLLLVTAIFSAIYATTTRNAAIQADRAVELEQAYAKLETAHVTIQQQALTDGLTGLPNHRAVMDLLYKQLQGAYRDARPFSVLFFDADRFKCVNDTHGHGAGDAVLCQIGERAVSILRGGETIGRFGGEEFVLLLPEADANQAHLVAERIRATIAAEPMALDEVQGGVAVTVSIGVATFPLDGRSQQELLSQADEAMYLAKRLGRNQVRSAQEVRHMNVEGELMAFQQ